ncbi:cell division suppressor protein YneA [Brevibacillus dissolubilis]|uniref:cell division suppressor protein YneA n=1 Tax=Brevibacillus dissolubilis TaxID=1844116 RepID=UPI0011169523|nr:LysM peptidoglycan-binding domain-containing protein [Brevibacillus dissolubilis]
MMIRLGMTRGQALLLVLVMALVYIGVISLFATGEAKAEQALSYHEVTVQRGDTIWHLASRYHEKAGMSVSELADAIMEHNELSGALIYPGKNLRIPVES